MIAEHQILEIMDDDTRNEWTARHVDCNVMVELYGYDSIAHNNDEEKLIEAIEKNSGKDFIIQWVLRNIGLQSIKEYIDELKGE